jgi:hypothetical protein
MSYEVGLESVDGRTQSEGGIANMVNAHGRKLATERPAEFELIAGLSYRFEQRDASTGRCVDEDQRASKAFIKGVVTGLLVADDSYGELADVSEILEIINVKDAPTADEEASLESREVINQSLADIGRRGLDQMHEAGQFIERWENECIRDYSHQYYYRLGFGLVMASANKVVYDKSMQELRQKIEMESVDWDDELRIMLDGSS